MIESTEKDPNLGVSDNLPFLCILDLFEIISDLVLAIPACADGIEQDDEADGNNSMEEDIEEWTNVEMMMSRNNGRSVGRPRSGRFVLEAALAEAVIGNILIFTWKEQLLRILECQ